MGHPRGANLCSHPGLLFFPLATTPGKALVRGVSLAQHGFGLHMQQEREMALSYSSLMLHGSVPTNAAL